MNSRSHIWRSRLVMLLAFLLIVWALLFGLLRMMLPHVTDYGDKIRSQLAKQLGIPVNVDTVDAEMWWLSPRLKLTGVDIYDLQGSHHLLHIEEILVGFDWLASMRQQRLQLGFVAFNGTQLQVQHRADGRWQVQGLLLPEPGEGPLQIPPELLNLLRDTSIYLHDIQLDWRDDTRNNQYVRLANVNVALLNDAPQHELAVDLELPAAYGGHVQLLASIEGELDQPADWQGRMYASLNRIQLKTWFDDYWQWFDFTANGVVDANVWCEWQALTLQQVQVVLGGEQLALHYLNDNVHTWKLDRLSGNLRWQSLEKGWQLDANGVEIHRGDRRWLQPTALSLQLDASQQELRLRSDYVQVNDLVYLAGLASTFLPHAAEQDWNTPLQAWQPRGDLFDVDLRLPLAAPEAVEFSSRFSDAGFLSQQSGLPSIEGLDGRVTYQHRQARVVLDSQDVGLDFHGLFRQPLRLQNLAADVYIGDEDEGLRVYAGDVAAGTAHIRTRSRLHLLIPDQAPVFMDLLTRYDQGQAAYTSGYLPTAIMGDDTVAWLDRGIVKGDLSGGFLFYGQLADFPFVDNAGVMLAQFDVASAVLDYQPDWPVITDLSARVRFKNSAMFIDQARGLISGARIANTTVAIDDMAHAPRLVVKGEVAGALPDMIRFVGDSPLKKPLAFVAGLQTRGDANLNLDLQIPLSGEETHTQVNGRLQLTGNELYLPDQDYRFKGVNGELRFTESSLQSDRLRASLDNYPLALRIEPTDLNGIAHSRIFVQGYAPLSSLLAPLPDWKKQVSGGSDWQATIDIPMQSRPDGIELAIAASGSLQGVSSDLPLFLAKPASQAGDMRFSLDLLQNGDLNIRAALSGVYQASAERRDQRWIVDADSVMLRGQARFAQDFELNETLKLDLDWVDLAALQAQQSQTSAVAEAPDSELDEDELLPRKIPPLQVRIAKLDWGKVKLHDIRLASRRSAAGMEIDHFELKGPEFSVSGKGSWLSSWRVPHTSRFDFEVKSGNLGSALAQMDLSQGLQKTEADGEFHWRWQDAPQNFSWQMLTGDARIHLKNGRLQNVTPGAGRLLGLFNFRTLLSLDFGEQMREGFAFDEVSTQLTFSNGNAWNENLSIQSKVADITMQGRFGLVQEDLDQTIVVQPRVGNTLTLIGTVAGGPVTGVMVHVFQKLLGVDKIVRYKYRVKGSWEKPETELVDAPQPANNEIEDL